MRQRQDGLYSHARGDLCAATLEAVHALRDAVTDPATGEATKVRAALGILDHALRLREVEEFDRRLERLEAALPR